ncbi:hypothetical protein JW859_14855 [bacterium]|nr:hypothetical protein [bacterium]
MSRTHNLLLWAAALSLALFLTGCGGGGDDELTTTGRDNPLPEQLVPEIQVQVVDHLYRVNGLTDDVLDNDPIFSIISSATSSLDIAVTRINRQEVVEALLNEANSGTQIRIVTERAYYEDPSYTPFYSQLEDITRNSGNIDIQTDDDDLPRVMHSRFLIIDNARVVTGSYNWETVNCEKTFGDVITILNTSVAAAFANQFNQMFVEGNFGVNKRNDTQHDFRVGAGNGHLEVYFGPTDQPRELILDEINQSATVITAIQQFKDVSLANSLLGWAQSSANHQLVALINNFGALGDAADNAVYDALLSIVDGSDWDGGAVYINDNIDFTGTFNGYNIMNHKLMFCDHAYSDLTPAMIFTTGNYSELGLTQNDEVMLVFRQAPLVNKYWRGISPTTTLPPDSIEKPGDYQEFDQLFAMWPYLSSANAELFRGFGDVPCGIVYGEADNYRPTVTITTDSNELEDVNIDLTFEVEGTLFFDGTAYGPLVPAFEDDIFEESELINPDHRYMLIVPAGEVLLRTIVTGADGEYTALFQPDEVIFDIGPGGVRRQDVKINQASTESADTGSA